MSRLVDTSVFCGYWPFRCLSVRTPEALKASLKSQGVSRAWVAASEAILYPDPMLGNDALFAAISGDPFFLPVAIIDPTLATWERDTRTRLGRHECGALKLVPNYHGYDLDGPSVASLVHFARETDVPVCIQVRMMDERSHHPLMKVPGVSCNEIASLANRHPSTRFLVCGAYRGELATLRDCTNVWCEISMVEAERSLWQAVDTLGPERVVYGSHSPFLAGAAALAKLDVGPVDVTPDVIRAVCSENCARLLGRTGTGHSEPSV